MVSLSTPNFSFHAEKFRETFPEIFLNVISLNFPLFLGGWGTFFCLKKLREMFSEVF
jgi:hypothetical protein